MMPDEPSAAKLGLADAATLKLVRLSAIITSGSESDLRDAFAEVRDDVPAVWVEELVLQSYLFAGFPRGLTAARAWRRISGREAPVSDAGADYSNAETWRKSGEQTCGKVYGARYPALRRNVRALHPALEAWMIVEGYGKVLSRPGLDLPRRELCVIASCAAARQDRQLHSHLHGALNVGASPADIEAAITSIADILGEEDARKVRLLWARVLGK
jgi:4-carboxymuconolactone decarboxylase